MSNEIQQIIVYRSPLEGALLNSTSSNPDVILYIAVWVILTVPIVSLMFNFFSHFDTRNRRNSSLQIILLVLGCIISAALTYGILNFTLI